MSIRTKLLGGFGLLAAVVVIVSGMALKALSDTNAEFSRYMNGINARATVSAQIRTAVDRRAIAARNLVLATKPSDVELELAEVNQAHKDVQDRLAKLKDMMANATDTSDRARELVADIVRIEASYGPVALRIVGLAQAGKKDEAIADIDDNCRPLLAQLVRATDAYATYTHERELAIAQQFADRYAMERNLLAGICLIAVVVAACGGLWLTRKITAPIGSAVDVARTVANGDLGSRINVSGNDETRDLLEALRTMNERLIGIVGRVRDSSNSIAHAVSEIASGNLDLSQRTEEQAASLQETAATMEEFTSTVRLNAENAQQASSLAANASDVAQRGSSVVGRVVDTMTEIGHSSSKIADITGIIEGIAFQTNILALNAAVEAARAGEQGRGFAVVASEVRSLAQRSSTAAKEIKELISASVQTIRDGSELAGEAGKTMSDVTQAVARVTDIMGEIAAASAEQSRGIDQVNLTITQMDETTQQNAALVEQAAAASKSLEAQGRELSETVAAFRMPSGTHVASPGAYTQEPAAHHWQPAAA
ncbi:MCP four helix bundle domain-containing protein [Burkholderia contaminans]|uniref:Methyl-accepting chemotaxis protein n=2 Tax=Burkholderia contaminans TaxID=488447 RepID=A0AAP4R298_9BURK|nr:MULTISPECIES: methyl-accepting chemotaxis protein [Burkholderia]MBD1410299.1 MCP four helix bundle domain-containing protein [Burkholderia contaminans]MBH9666231.1 MCP four helix bundle domain-containing protein [Burkholderia contaminans]MBH9674219.1 MCP four helix bundle domain-containing protein [Burkholderia contaminans]MBH9704265.1 MCP four helix bundle domain-containing protein [Burkholderia contaminans]MBH9719276.1 MCP four helix bundle domain-containing protein [Burkholderia contamin